MAIALLRRAIALPAGRKGDGAQDVSKNGLRWIGRGPAIALGRKRERYRVPGPVPICSAPEGKIAKFVRFN